MRGEGLGSWADFPWSRRASGNKRLPHGAAPALKKAACGKTSTPAIRVTRAGRRFRPALAGVRFRRRSGRVGTEQLGRAANDLVVRNVLQALRQTPPVSERVHDLPMALTPERVLQWRVHLSPFGQRSVPELVDRIDRDREGAVCAPER